MSARGVTFVQNVEATKFSPEGCIRVDARVFAPKHDPITKLSAEAGTPKRSS